MTQIVDTKSIHLEILNRSEVSQAVEAERNVYTYSERIPIGSGTFGTVCKAKCDQTGQIVAIKTVFQDRTVKNRELQTLAELDHPNVISLIDSFYTIKEGSNGGKYLNVVMDYVPNSLYQVIHRTFKNDKPLNIPLLKSYAYQLLKAVNYMKEKGVCHRDIKPQNILVDTTTNQLKLCDFGSAKKLVQGEKNVSYICSRYYRAPELIFNSGNYTNAVDMWSVGCVIAEIILNKPIFPGRNAADQLFEIIKVLGTPTKAEISKMNADYTKYKFPMIKCFPLKEIFKGYLNELGQDFFDLLSKMFDYNPEARITPMEALHHPFFNSLNENQNQRTRN